MKAWGGFTLVELMVTLAVLAIVLVIGVPGLQALVNGNRLAATANEAIASLQTARMEAIRRNRRVVVCTSTKTNAGDGATCATAGIDGWITFVDSDRSNDFSAGDTLLRNSLLDGGMAVAGPGAVVFRADGLARDASGDLLDDSMRIVIDSDHPAQNVRCVDIRTSGAVAVRTPASHGGSCG
ncbi:MAG TPA: GspH/FimT family pseudopilin [Luteimonas sp.]|nr:GspH/FimT family pseudopilin [Luteimonas sp.]